jgi:hypothetical protein
LFYCLNLLILLLLGTPSASREILNFSLPSDTIKESDSKIAKITDGLMDWLNIDNERNFNKYLRPQFPRSKSNDKINELISQIQKQICKYKFT